MHYENILDVIAERGWETSIEHTGDGEYVASACIKGAGVETCYSGFGSSEAAASIDLVGMFAFGMSVHVRDAQLKRSFGVPERAL